MGLVGVALILFHVVEIWFFFLFGGVLDWTRLLTGSERKPGWPTAAPSNWGPLQLQKAPPVIMLGYFMADGCRSTGTLGLPAGLG